MSFFENIRDKAEDLAEEHEEKIDQGLEKVGELINDKTGGEHAEHVDKGVDKAQDLVENLGDDDPAPG